MKTVNNLMRLDNRVAIITGGGGHIGDAISNALAEAGCTIAVVDVNKDAAELTRNGLESQGYKAIDIVADLEKQAEVQAIPDQVMDKLGRIDILINCAALVGTSSLTGWNEPFDMQSPETWRRALEVNMTACFELTQKCLPHLKASEHGSIINFGSIYGIIGPDLRLYENLSMHNPAAYAASKGGIIQFTKWCATIFAPAVRVNAITPGGVYRNQEPAFVERYESRTPMKRMACEEDFKGAALYLASDLSLYVTGQNIVVDGGFSVW